MQAIYRLNANEIDLNFFEALKKLWSNKKVTITIEVDNEEIDQKELWQHMEATRKKYPLFKVSKDINLSDLANEVNL